MLEKIWEHANHSHVCCSCIKLQPLLDRFLKIFWNIFNFRSPKDLRIMFLGLILNAISQTEDAYLLKCFILAYNKVVKRNWLKCDPASYIQWWEIVEEIYVMEN
ncbi:hypothetical protein GOODEAATRI_025423 [Goodea atripinnis]|uniref:Uncharacterized protein n=1 Tax=Goodea atripinnis TaxID=208336 RepID=A0ABV0ML16_9TELE